MKHVTVTVCLAALFCVLAAGVATGLGMLIGLFVRALCHTGGVC